MVDWLLIGVISLARASECLPAAFECFFWHNLIRFVSAFSSWAACLSRRWTLTDSSSKLRLIQIFLIPPGKTS